jgi:hypothetical protein
MSHNLDARGCPRGLVVLVNEPDENDVFGPSSWASTSPTDAFERAACAPSLVV